MPDLQNATQLDYLADALAETFPGLLDGNNGRYFQFSIAPIAADWVSGTDADAYDHANAVPASVDRYYSPSDFKVDASYATLLTAITPKQGDKDPDYLSIQQKLQDAENVQKNVATQANAAYQAWSANNPGPNGTVAENRSKWLQDPLGGLSWSNQLTDTQNKVTEYQGELKTILTALDAGLAAAIGNLTTDTMNISTGSGAVSEPRVVIGGNLAADKARWDGYAADEFDFQPPPITSQSVIKSPWQSVVTTTVHHDCWGSSVETTVDTSRIIRDVNYKLEMTAVGLQSYGISRGKWYDGTFVDPNAQITPGAVDLSNDSFFGPDGSLHMIPELFVVMYRPTFKLTVSTETFKQELEAKAESDLSWISLFGFQYQFSSMASLTPVDNGTTTTITFQAPHNSVPQIIGVVSRAVYNGSTAAPTGNVAVNRAA